MNNLEAMRQATHRFANGGALGTLGPQPQSQAQPHPSAAFFQWLMSRLGSNDAQDSPVRMQDGTDPNNPNDPINRPLAPLGTGRAVQGPPVAPFQQGTSTPGQPVATHLSPAFQNFFNPAVVGQPTGMSGRSGVQPEPKPPDPATTIPSGSAAAPPPTGSLGDVGSQPAINQDRPAAYSIGDLVSPDVLSQQKLVRQGYQPANLPYASGDGSQPANLYRQTTALPDTREQVNYQIPGVTGEASGNRLYDPNRQGGFGVIGTGAATPDMTQAQATAANVAALNRQTDALSALREARNPGITTGGGSLGFQTPAPADPWARPGDSWGDSGKRQQEYEGLLRQASDPSLGRHQREGMVQAAQAMAAPGMAAAQSQNTLQAAMAGHQTAAQAAQLGYQANMAGLGPKYGEIGVQQAQIAQQTPLIGAQTQEAQAKAQAQQTAAQMEQRKMEMWGQLTPAQRTQLALGLKTGGVDWKEETYTDPNNPMMSLKRLWLHDMDNNRAGFITPQGDFQWRSLAANAPSTAPPLAAVQHLKANDSPEMRKYFDTTFGAGAAARAMGG